MMIRLLQILLLLFSVINDDEHPCKTISPSQPDVIDAVRSFRNSEYLYSSDDEMKRIPDGIEMDDLKYSRLLPPRDLGKKKTLVLDMDETMVYAGSVI